MTVLLATLDCPVRHVHQDFTDCVLNQVAAPLDQAWERVFPVSVMDTAASVILRPQYARIVSITPLVISVSDVSLATMELSGDCQMTVTPVLVL